MQIPVTGALCTIDNGPYLTVMHPTGAHTSFFNGPYQILARLWRDGAAQSDP